MTAPPLSDAEIEELKILLPLTVITPKGSLYDPSDKLDRKLRTAVPRLIAEIETSRRSKSAAGYAMWNAAVEACAKAATTEWTYQNTQLVNGPDRHEYGAFVAARITYAIRSLMTPKGPAERSPTGAEDMHSVFNPPKAPSAPPPGEGEIEEAALREIIRIKDDTLGTRFPGEPLNQHETELRESFDRGCRMAFYRCADIATSALRRLTQPQNAAAGEGGK